MSASRRTRPAQPAPEASALVARFATEQVPRGVDYTQVLRTPHASAPVALVGVGLGVLSFLILAPLVMQALAAGYWVAVGRPGTFAETYADLVAYRLPFGLTVSHLGLATLIPITFGLLLVVHRVRPSYASSVAGKLRWRYFWPSLGIGFVVLVGMVVLQNATASNGAVWRPQPDFWWFVLAVLLTSPLQAAAEEYFFRGYLMQALGSLVRTPWFGIVASAALFALFHGTQQNVPLIVDRFAFGVLAGYLVWRTGGLEAGIAVHVANNVSAFVLAGLTSSMAEVKATTVVDWPAVGWDLGRFVVFAVLALLLARRMKLQTVVE